MAAEAILPAAVAVATEIIPAAGAAAEAILPAAVAAATEIIPAAAAEAILPAAVAAATGTIPAAAAEAILPVAVAAEAIPAVVVAVAVFRFARLWQAPTASGTIMDAAVQAASQPALGTACTRQPVRH